MNTQRQQSGVDIKNTTPVKCSKCEGQVFSNGVMMRKVSALVSPSGKDGISAVPVFVCIKCQEVVSELLPEELKTGLSLA